MIRVIITQVCWLRRDSESQRRAEGRSTADDAASGRASASGASATFLNMRVCRRSAAGRARLLARSGAAVTLRPSAAAPLTARPPAAPAPLGAIRRGLRPHCGAAESGFI
jgi:hypothetical protein